MSRQVVLASLIGFICSTIGCGDPSSDMVNSVHPKVGTPSVKPLPSEYRTLARHLAMEITTSPAGKKQDDQIAVVLAEAQTALLDLKAIQSDDPDIMYVAGQGCEIYRDGIRHIEVLTAMPKPPDEFQTYIRIAIGSIYTGSTGDPRGLADSLGANLDAEDKRNAIVDMAQQYVALRDKDQAARLLLSKIAAKYAATPSDPGQRISVDMNAAWGPHGPNDQLRIYNAGPTDLADCTIQVRLTGAAGQVHTNVHFVHHWPAKSWLYAEYQPGKEFLDRTEFGKSTVKELDQVELTLWSPQFTTSLAYQYQGEEKDEDIATYCESLSFTGKYQPFVDGILWDTPRGIELTLNGIKFIPQCLAEVTFRRGTQMIVHEWEIEEWTEGENKSFSVPDDRLKFDPAQIDIELSFPGTAFTHTSTLNFP